MPSIRLAQKCCKSLLTEVLVSRQGLINSPLLHHDKADGIAEGIGFIKTVFQEFDSGSCEGLIDPDHFNFWCI